MRLTVAVVIVFFASVAQAQTVVTANPTAIDFGTLTAGEFDTETVTYTCTTGPCVGAAPKVLGGHTVLVSANTCKTLWTFFVPGQTGDTCSVSWTLTATNVEGTNCPDNVCTGTVGISVTDGTSGDAVVASDGYTVTVFSPKPTLSITPTPGEIGDFGCCYDPYQTISNNPPPESWATITNTSEDTVSVSATITTKPVEGRTLTPPPFALDYSSFSSTLAPGQTTQLGVIFVGTQDVSCWHYGPHYKECYLWMYGTVEIWGMSTTPGAPPPYLQKKIPLSGEEDWNGCDEGACCGCEVPPADRH
jgi:hypothetical protein